MAYNGQMPRLWRWDNLQDKGGVGGGDVLMELVNVTFATTTTASVPTVFADGNVLAVFVSRVSGTGTYTVPKTVASAALTMTNTITNSTDVVDVMIIGRLQV
jgi:hypothetical protein